MIVPDANLLLYAYNASAAEHERARLWLEDALSANETVGLAWQTITAFIRIGTNPRAYPRPFSSRAAVQIVREWLAQPVANIITPTDRHWAIFGQLVVEGQCAGPLVMDAHLAALTLEHGAVLCSHDADFARFKGVRRSDPLAG